jgi:sugar phosphate isomerase/epimerase
MVYLSCHSENFGILDAEENFAFIKRLGFDRVDVAARTVIPQSKITADPKGSAKWMKELAARHGLGLSELFLSSVEVDGKGLSPASPDAKDNAVYFHNFELICEFAAEAGFECVMGSGGSVIESIGKDASFDNAEAVYRSMADIAEKWGLVFTVEPSRLSLLNSPAAALEMVRRVPKLRYTLDLLHYQINGYPQEESMKLLPWTGHMHARQAATGWGKCPVEFGEIDYDTLIKRMRGMNWEGTIAMEYWCGPGEEAAGILAVDQNILMRYELKQLIKKYFG